MARILIIGCLSFDILHLEQNGPRQTYSTTGGAGLYTALAASAGGAEVTLYAPRPKSPSEELSKITSRINWIGPLVDLEAMPRLEIVQHGDDRATLLSASWGAEELLTSDHLRQTLGSDLSDLDRFTFDVVHVAALSTVERQRKFVSDLKPLSLRQANSHCKFSAGTYARAISADTQGVRALLAECDYFFMNSNEAHLLFNNEQITEKIKTNNRKGLAKILRENQICIVTNGGAGADLLFGPLTNRHIDAAQLKSAAIDPTGAGDTFCGALLAALGDNSTCNNQEALIETALEGARRGAILASQIICSVGSSHYL